MDKAKFKFRLSYLLYIISTSLVFISYNSKNLNILYLAILVITLGFSVDLFYKYKELNEKVNEIRFRIKDDGEIKDEIK